jgi:hypothetical protein
MWVISGRSRVKAAAWLAGHADQGFLVLDQAQPDLLLRDLGIALDGFGLPLDFLIAQVPEGRNDGSQKEQHREQRRQRGEAVLTRGRLAPPPAPEEALGAGPRNLGRR